MLTDTLDPDPSKWCKFQIVDQISCIIVSCVVVAKCLLFCIFMRSLTIRYQHKIIISPDQYFLFRIIGLWFAIAFLKSILNIVVFAVFQSNDQYHNAKSEIILSAICTFTDKLSSFTLHTILIRIPCLWIKNTVIRLDGSDLTLQQSKQVNVVFRILEILKYYQRIRLIIPLINLAFAIYFIIDPNFGRFSQYLTFMTLFEALVAIFTYTFGILSLNRFKELLSFPQWMKKRVAIQYFLLLTCCLARFVFNILYYFHFALRVYDPSDNCFDNNDRVNYVSYIYLSVGYATMHIMPISTIIIIYWPEVEKGNNLVSSIISTLDNKLLKRKVTLTTNCCLLGSQPLNINEKQNEITEESMQDNSNSQIRVFVDK